MNFRRRYLALSLIACGLTSAAVCANTLQLSQEGNGEVLIYPYYTVRNGTVSLLSLVNSTYEGKAVRLRVREAIGGRAVAELNVFLSPLDVWTAAIVPTTDGGTTIVSNDKSCTHPKISGSSTGLVFSSAGFATDNSAYTPYTPADRTREGYIELLEMATLPTASLLGKDTLHNAGVPACRLVSDASGSAAQSTLTPPSGGLFGGMSFINLNEGLGVSYNATAINGFWKTGPGAPLPTITAPQSPNAANPASAPDLTSGGNTTIMVSDRGNTYISTFARSIDAVSALLMVYNIRGEYGFTDNGVFSSAMIMTLPTKPYYVYSAATAPFQRAFTSGTTAQSCDDATLQSVDREEYVGVINDGPNPPTATPELSWCGMANVYSFTGSLIVGTAFNSPRLQAVYAVQNQGLSVPVGKEGGHIAVSPRNPAATLTPISSSVLARSKTTGELTWQSAAHTYFGLPMLGFAISVAKYNAGSPQQNFGNMNALTTHRQIYPRP